MRIFIYEYICASSASSPLRTEGWAMLAAIVEDFAAIPGCEISTLLDDGCKISLGHDCRRTTPENEETLFRSLAAEADATLVIAPETAGILAQRSQWVLDEGGKLLGCHPTVISLTADKKLLAVHWKAHGVPTPPLVDGAGFPGYPVVLKPRDGAGSQATFLIRDEEGWRTSWEEARRESPESDFIVQPFVPGISPSVAFLGGSCIRVPLAPCAQYLSEDGRFHYLGGEVPLEPSLARRAIELGRRAVEAVPGWAGYVGVDLVLGESGENDVAIEFNPRLTTSYLGLRRLARGNLAQHWLAAFAEETEGIIEPPQWLSGPIRFCADGRVEQ